MYIPTAFAEADPAVATALIDANGFSVLISHGEAGPVATHLPLQLDTPARLVGHVARANPHWRSLDGAAVLAIFAGPHAFVSPRWYTTDAAVPTWNYEAVHVHGIAHTTDDPERLRPILAALVRRYDPEWSMDRLEQGFLDRMLRGIVGIEIDVTRIETKRKLSQNRPVEDIAGVIEALEAGGEMDRAVAAAMRETACR